MRRVSPRSSCTAGERGRIPVGISQCLLGDAMRYDGSHKHDPYLTGTLGRVFEFVPICPEVGIGMGVPRPPIRLMRRGGVVRAVGVEDPTMDVTERLIAYAQARAKALSDVCGYIFKRGSPSCGIAQVPIYSQRGVPSRTGAGLYAQTLMQALPWLPCEDEGRLADVPRRENFIQRVGVCYRWRELNTTRLSAARLQAFHRQHRLVIITRGLQYDNRLVKLLEDTSQRLSVRAQRYIVALMQVLQKPATRAGNTRVMRQLSACLKPVLKRADWQVLCDGIATYQRGTFPLSLPLNLLRRHFQSDWPCDIEWRYYLYPLYPQLWYEVAG